MVIHGHITDTSEVEIKVTMLGQQGQHVVKEGHARGDAGTAGAIHVEGEFNISLGSLASDRGGAGGGHEKKLGVSR